MATSQHPTSSRGISSGGAAAAGGIGFQAQLGALFGLQLLAQVPVDHVLELGAAVPVWIRFETEAPVDDILVATSEGGFIAVQAKTTVNLSSAADGGLAKTVQQFIRHWLACRDGQGEQLWDRSLDPNKDRLVLAVGPTASASIRVDLTAALRSHSQPSPGALTQNQQRALEVFETCMREAWSNTTTEPWSPTVLRSVAQLVRVMTFDPAGAYANVMEGLAARATTTDQARALITALTEISQRWMTQRNGGDLPQLRRAVMHARVPLSAPPRFENDIRKLREHSAQIAADLRPYEQIEITEGVIRITRECQAAALAAAQEGSLLLIGEPGAGKSAVINALARELRSHGDVVELAVDRYSVQDLVGLKNELDLEHDLVKVLEAWDGPSGGWLVVDALDATRGGQGEGAFRTLIERVLALKGRWKVVASIRTFDLRMGVRFRELFAGRPANPDYRDAAFPTVRHLLVPHWSEEEFDQALNQAPELRTALDGAPTKLRQLALVPFNTRLIGELLRTGMGAEAFRELANQAGLLRLYWEHRVTPLGSRADACLRFVVQAMVDSRALRAQTHVIAATAPDALDALLLKGVLAKVENERFIQFRHHLLFDYAASRLLMDVDGLVSGEVQYLKAQTIGLMLAPAMGFLLQELWGSQPDHERYWIAVERMVGNPEGDPILRSVAGRLSAELPENAADTYTIAKHVADGRDMAPTALWHVVSALAVRLEDHPNVSLTPWVSLAGELAASVERVSSPLRTLLYLLINTARPSQRGEAVGHAARALLGFVFDHPESRIDAALVIPNVVATYATAPSESRALLERIFEPQRADAHNWEDVPALCREISKLADTDPDFAATVYSRTYAGTVKDDVTTSMGGRSQILSLTSNSRQDYGMALFSLCEFFPTFLQNHPRAATRAFVESVDHYIRREHKLAEREVVTRTIDGRTLGLETDLSHIWSHDPDHEHGQDGDALIAKFLPAFVALPESDARLVADQISTSSTWALIWARLFLAAVRRNDSLIDRLWPIAADEAWLSNIDTQKDAIDLVARGYGRRSMAEREALETSVTTFSMEGYKVPEAARRHLTQRLYSVIGSDQLVTESARAVLAATSAESVERSLRNERPFRITSGFGQSAPFFWIEGLDRDRPSNITVMNAIEAARDYIEAKPGRPSTDEIDTSRTLELLEAIVRGLEAPDLDDALRSHGEGVIGQGCGRLAQGGRLVVSEGFDPTDRYLALLRIAAASGNPEVTDETESQYEQSQSWGGPAARIEAATAVLDVCLQRADLYPRLVEEIDRLLDDRHPAARSQSVRHLIRLWDLDRAGFWRRLELRLERETNFAVLGSVVNLLRMVIHVEPERSERLVLALLARYGGTVKQADIEVSLADLVAILSVTHQRASAEAVLSRWLDDPSVHSGQLGTILFTLRDAVVLGLHPGQAEEGALRHRAQALLHRIVVAASGPLATYNPSAPVPDDQVPRLKACVELIDKAAMQLYFATGRVNGGTGIDEAGCEIYLREIESTLNVIAVQAQPHTIYQLLQLMEILAPHDAERVFDLTARAIRGGGAKGGYQYEPLGAELMVRLISSFLADSKEIFGATERRQALVDCLEIFMEAGWPSARKLLYRLPELLQ
ncbi:zeta toxin family protein [Burkholderia ubonensis]|uniref:zeta toxin family protein n=1 Tax=Burkholderia ubonensis TaxID=101571 RepID=UPI0012FC644C|nr:zeta toxin family protein [Burkholderia ubonensis]